MDGAASHMAFTQGEDGPGSLRHLLVWGAHTGSPGLLSLLSRRPARAPCGTEPFKPSSG